MHSVIQAIDIRDPQRSLTDVVQLHAVRSTDLKNRIQALYPHVAIEVDGQHTLLLKGNTQDLADAKALISSLDVSPSTPAPTPMSQDAVPIRYASPKNVARAIASQIAHIRASVSGSSIVLTGSVDDVARAKSLAQTLDNPPTGARYTDVYRLHNVDATSVGDLIAKSFPNVTVTVDKDLNALSVLGTAAEHLRISSAIAQLDASSAGANGSGASPALGSSNVDIVRLDSAMPGLNGAASTTAQDIVTAVQQLLQSSAPDLKITSLPNTSTILLAGSPMSVRLAKDLIARLDEPQPLVVLDTEVLEVDESAAKNVGLQFPGASIQSGFAEIQPTPNPITGQPGRLIGLQPLSRTAIQFSAELNFLVQHGDARVLADPRVTTISGHTATIRAGDTINILTQTSGGVGTPVTQQLQQFNTGVTLDITPVVGPSGNVTVALHPVVNSLAGLLNNVPQIATRDTQTVVQLQDNQTLVIGGLIQETMQRQISKLPILGDIPLVGKVFQNSDVQSQRNELVIVVTPHILKPGAPQPPPESTLPLPSPEPLPTLPPGTQLPNMRYPSPHPEPSPISVASAANLFTPAPSASAVPIPTPTAFSNANVFVFGSPPPNSYASDMDAPQIFFVQFAPTLLQNGTPVQVSVITTTNVKKVDVGYPGYTSALSQIAPSKWQGNFAFNASGLSSGQQTYFVKLSAYGQSGAVTSIQIPISLIR